MKESRKSVPGYPEGRPMGIRPNFAEDVYGDKKSEKREADEPEFSDSSLAHRRSASVLKLKQLKDAQSMLPNDVQGIQRHESSENNDRDLEFSYTDTDTLFSEISELYSYSELDEFASNIVFWRSYADTHDVESPFYFSSLPDIKKKSIMQDLCSRLESAEPDMRLNTARIVLYLLQGSVLDFVEEDELSEGQLPKAPENRGSGGFEEDCLVAGARNSYICYSNGVYQALCTLLMTEMNEPFECGLSDGRLSKASSRDSRSASNADLSDNERSRSRRNATMVDNEALRVVLSCLYHMVEFMRDDSITKTLTVENSKTTKIREEFFQELEEPIEHGSEPLIVVLFEMLPPFYMGAAPHYPVKKILLLIWKILLVSLGGWDVLEEKKKTKRAALGLPQMENTLKVASSMPATLTQDNECARLIGRRTAGVPRAGMIARQLAYNEDSRDDEFKSENGFASEVETSDYEDTNPTEGNDQPSRQASGDRTPRVGSPVVSEPPKRFLPWTTKVRSCDFEEFIQSGRSKFFNYRLPPGDTSTLFGLPPPILSSIEVLRKNIYVSLSELQVNQEEDLNRFLFSKVEKVEETKCEGLYRRMLPNLSQYIIALLKVLLAAAPSNKAKSEALNILIDVLTPESDGSDVLSNSISLDHSTASPLEDSVRLAIDINRHKEILVKATSAILLLLVKHLKLNHIYQYEFVCQHVVYGNGIPLLLKYLDQNINRYVQARYEIHAYNYPQCLLHYVRNGEEWPLLDAENVEEKRGGVYYMWRNVFSSINMIRLLNKLVKGKQSRVMMLMVFKSAPILKRALKIRLSIFQLYVLKALKMQSRYLGRQWRKSNMDIISAIYSRVRHRMTDDWAFASDMRRSYEYQIEENSLKAAVERFHSRRYAKLYPQFAIEVNDAPMPGDDYLNRVDMREFEPVDNCAHSVLGAKMKLGDRFERNYEQWMEREVLRAHVDWDKLLLVAKGIEDIPLGIQN
ncbi:unnamed protein product [Caenorhabditis auriculariae]|uniref:Uncharacterized protein n=1 Tax=Caenorhabditis auriculariae TaxID=2777116 RepID=A0A8S1HFH8_9PELO|nr:unnamed protein product [Caenorhabditis auriculariae]